jgi:hypothetical protein
VVWYLEVIEQAVRDLDAERLTSMTTVLIRTI